MCEGIAGNLREDRSRTARALQEICRGMQGNCKGTAKSLRGPCLQGMFTALQLAGTLQLGACRGAAGQLHGNCKGTCRVSARDPQGLC